MFSKRGTERLAGVSLIAAFVAFVAHTAAYLTGNENLVALCFLVYGVLAILSAVTLCLTFRPFERTLAVISASGFAAHGVLIVVFAAMCWALAEFPAGSATISADALTADVDASVVATTARALEMTLGAVMSCAFIVLSLGLGALGILLLWSGGRSPLAGLAGCRQRTCGVLGPVDRIRRYRDARRCRSCPLDARPRLHADPGHPAACAGDAGGDGPYALGALPFDACSNYT